MQTKQALLSFRAGVKKLPPEVLEFFRRQGAKGGKLGGRKGGLIGGKRSLETMTPEERQERASKAAAARWGKKGQKKTKKKIG